jgi:hypothetical protein
MRIRRLLDVDGIQSAQAPIQSAQAPMEDDAAGFDRHPQPAR